MFNFLRFLQSIKPIDSTCSGISSTLSFSEEIVPNDITLSGIINFFKFLHCIPSIVTILFGKYNSSTLSELKSKISTVSGIMIFFTVLFILPPLSVVNLPTFIPLISRGTSMVDRLPSYPTTITLYLSDFIYKNPL